MKLIPALVFNIAQKISVLDNNNQSSADPENTVPQEVCDYDFSDAPEWAVPREWFIEGRYDLEQDII